MVIAATYYGVAAVTAFRYWYWALLLFALPFFIFSLLDIHRDKRKKDAVCVMAVSGALILAGAACGVFAAGWMAQPVALHAVATASPVRSASPALAVSPSPTIAAIPILSATKASSAAPSTATATHATAPAPTEAFVPVKLTDQEYHFFASKNSKTFHLPGCSSAKRVNPDNLIGFKTREEAIAAGYEPCKRCKP